MDILIVGSALERMAMDDKVFPDRRSVFSDEFKRSAVLRY